MINIAICDDNLADTERIEEQVLKLQSHFSEKINTSIFYSGLSFCEAIKETCPFDIILMDIEMKELNGIEVGQKLRSDDENDLVLLIYISSHDDYYIQLFDVQPYAFIEKPINSDDFFYKLKKAINKTLRSRQNDKRKILPIYRNGQEVLIPFQKILYLESKIRKIRLFTTDTDEVIEYYGTLNKEEQKLSKNEFVRTHQSYIANLHHLKEITSESLTLIDNREIPISNSRKDYVKECYIKYRRSFFE